MPPKKATAAKRAAGTGKQKTPNNDNKAAARESAEPTEHQRAYKATNPTTYEEFSEAQRYLYDQRRAGKSWEELNPGWERLTGEKPGRDVLRKRYAKLAAVATEWTPEDEGKLCEIKKGIDNEIAFYLDLIEKQVWDRVTAKLEGAGIPGIKAAAVQARYEKLEREGKIGDDGLLREIKSTSNVKAAEDSCGAVKDVAVAE